MDPFAVATFGCLVALVGWVWLLGRGHRGDGLEQLGLRTPRQIVEDREAADAEDLQQMLDAHNARRRRRGEREVTLEDLEAQVIADANEVRRRREQLLAERELEQLLEATNARRRARGLPERTREEVEREFGGA